MSDNTTLNAGTGGDVIASDDIGGVKHQQVKVEWGVDGTATPVSAANPMPVVQTGTHAVNATLAAETTKVIGTVNIAAAQTIATVTTVSAVTAISNALPAGNNNIGDVDIASIAAGDNNIGNVDVVTLPALPSGSNNIGSVTAVGAAAEDAAASGNPVLVGGRYDSSARTLETGDAGAIALNASGQVLVEIAAGAGSGGTSAADGATFTRNTTSITPVGAVVESSAPTLNNGDVAGLSQTTGGALRVDVASGGVAGIVDDAAFTPGTTEGVVFMAHADETTPDSVDEGDAGALRMTLARALHVNVRDDAGDSCMDGTNNAVRVNVVAGAGSGGTASTDDAAFTAASGSGTPMMGFATSDSVDSGDVGVVAMTTARALHTAVQSIAAGNNNIGDVDVASIAAGDNNIGNVDIVTVPADPFGANADAASATGSISAKLRFIAATGIPITGTVTVGSHAVTNAGTFATQVDGAALTALQLIDDPVIADDAAFTPATSKVMMAGFEADESSTDSVDEGDAGAARMTLDRKQIVTSYAHAAAGGATPYQNLDVDESEDDVKTSPGKVFWVYAINLSTTKKYLKFYNATAANVTVGSTTPVLTLPLPTMGDANGSGFTINFGDIGVQFDTAICIAATTGFAVADTGAPGANEVIVNLGYL